MPSKFDINNLPTSSTCTQDAVNICDLLSVFDSLSRRLAAVEAELASLKTGLPVFVSLTFSEITFNSMKATAEFTNSGAPISFYFVKLPAGFSGDYNDLTNVPTNVSAFNNDAGYLTSYTEVQALCISNDTIYLTGGSFVKLPVR